MIKILNSEYFFQIQIPSFTIILVWTCRKVDCLCNIRCIRKINSLMFATHYITISIKHFLNSKLWPCGTAYMWLPNLQKLCCRKYLDMYIWQHTPLLSTPSKSTHKLKQSINESFIPTQDPKPSLGRRPKDGFVSKLVYIFLPSQKPVHLSGYFSNIT